MRATASARWLLVVLAVLALEIVARRHGLGPTLSVPPSAMFARLATSLARGELTPHLARTASEIFAGFALGAAAGLPAGAFLWRFPVAAATVEPVLLAYYAVPIFSLYPVLIVVLGAGVLPIVVIGALAAVGSIVMNTLVGLREIPPVYVKVARTLGLSRAQLVRHVIVPAILPPLFVGLKLGFIYALINVIAAEFILATSGLGYEVSYHYNNFESADMFAVILLVIVLSVGVNAALGGIERRLAHRRA